MIQPRMRWRSHPVAQWGRYGVVDGDVDSAAGRLQMQPAPGRTPPHLYPIYQSRRWRHSPPPTRKAAFSPEARAPLVELRSALTALLLPQRWSLERWRVLTA